MFVLTKSLHLRYVNVMTSSLHNINFYAKPQFNETEQNKAMTRFESARQFYKKAKHYLHRALSEDNSAVFFQKKGCIIEAHKHTKASSKNFKKQGDKTFGGYSLDTRAKIYLAEGKYEEALKCINEAIMMLPEDGNYYRTANTYQTKSKIELGMNKFPESFETIIKSIHIADLHISNEQAKKFIGEYIELLKNRGLK
jgi:tetratricopeptide (TPR) repeat protein